MAWKHDLHHSAVQSSPQTAIHLVVECPAHRAQVISVARSSLWSVSSPRTSAAWTTLSRSLLTAQTSQPGSVAASYFSTIAILYAAVKVRRFGWDDRGPSAGRLPRPPGV